mgnify:CR=1 FL=1
MKFFIDTANLKDIKEMPTSINYNHESLYKSYQTLKIVREMLKRGDSKKTIINIINFIYE